YKNMLLSVSEYRRKCNLIFSTFGAGSFPRNPYIRLIRDPDFIDAGQAPLFPGRMQAVKHHGIRRYSGYFFIVPIHQVYGAGSLQITESGQVILADVMGAGAVVFVNFADGLVMVLGFALGQFAG
ncbi:hypothetical protein, partial [Klebsiella pneumoniae]|uniref:hypothetical protein n=1 Tax=Klebsiella pneumoniae TaxID=573 RepID=UPI0024E0EA6D